MYAYTTRVTLHPDPEGEGARRWREQMLPWLRAQPGFRRLLLLVEEDAHRGMAIMFWDAPGDWEAASAGFGPLAREHLHPLIDAQGQHLDEGFAVALDE
jgi:hypothetical protein